MRRKIAIGLAVAIALAAPILFVSGAEAWGCGPGVKPDKHGNCPTTTTTTTTESTTTTTTESTTTTSTPEVSSTTTIPDCENVESECGPDFGPDEGSPEADNAYVRPITAEKGLALTG